MNIVGVVVAVVTFAVLIENGKHKQFKPIKINKYYTKSIECQTDERRTDDQAY